MPRDEATLREELREALAVTDGPTVLRFPKGSVLTSLPALERVGPVDVLRRGASPEVLLVAVAVRWCRPGSRPRSAPRSQGIEVTVVDPRWVLPASPELVDLCAGHKLVVTLEDGGRSAGWGRPWPPRCATPSTTSRCAASGCPGVPEHGSRTEVLADHGLTEQDVARRIVEWAAQIADRTAQAEEKHADR